MSCQEQLIKMQVKFHYINLYIKKL